jgi:hypothetical protein
MNKNNEAKIETHQGRCHCGSLRFEVDLDVSQGATRCNCSICVRVSGSWSSVKPEAFRLLGDEAQLGKYPNSIGARFFCPTCGVHAYGRGDLPQLGGAFVSVNWHCFDDIDVGGIKIGYWDGRHDNWQAGLRPTPWPVFTSKES